MPAPSYAQSQGLRLLERAVQTYGPLFTRQDLMPLAGQQGLSPGHLSKIISLLKASGHLVILKRGLYLVRSPLFAGEVHPFAIATALIQPSAVSHWSALAHHGFTTQLPRMVQVSTPSKVVTPEMRRGRAHRPRGRAVWQVGDIEVEFIHVRPQAFFGHQQVWVSRWHQVAVTDPERTALDLLARPDVFGGVSAALELLEAALPRLNVGRLVDYALRLKVGAVIKRLGWALEQMGVTPESLEPLRAYPVRTDYRLDPRKPPGGQRSPRWRVIENLETPAHA